MIPMICFKFIFLVLLLPLLTAANSPADKLDPRYVSQLRFELRNVGRPDQCLLFWKGVSEKLQDVADYSLPEDGADFEMLTDLSRMLKFHRAYHKLSEFVDECSAILKDLPQDKVTSHTAFKSKSRALELPNPAPNQQELDQLKKETQTLQEEVAKKDKLIKEMETQTKLKLEKLNVALLAREQQLLESNKGREQEKELCKEKLDDLKKQTETKEKQLNQEKEGSLQELNKLKKELEEKSKSYEQKLELLEKTTKEKEQLVKEIEKLKVELESKESKQKVETKCPLEAEQRKFQQDRKKFTEKIEMLEEEVKRKTKEMELEKEKWAKKLQEATSETKEKAKKSSKSQKKVKDHEESKLESRDDMIRLYDHVFFDNSQRLEPGKLLEHFKLLEKNLKGYKDPAVKTRYKTLDQFISISKMKQKRCTKKDWDKLKELIQKHTNTFYSSMNIQHYLQFWFIQRQDYCSRFYPHMMQ